MGGALPARIGALLEGGGETEGRLTVNKILGLPACGKGSKFEKSESSHKPKDKPRIKGVVGEFVNRPSKNLTENDQA